MSSFFRPPYTTIEGVIYPHEIKFSIIRSSFFHINFEDGRFTYVFSNCWFNKLEIENIENITFENISISFANCYINEIHIEKIHSSNISVSFFNSILAGSIRSSQLTSVTINNCFANNHLFLVGIKNVDISFTEENIFLKKWKKLFKSSGKEYQEFLGQKQSFNIYNPINFSFHFHEIEPKKSRVYRNPHTNDNEYKIQYSLSEEEKKQLRISVNIHYSPEIEHKKTKIIQARLYGLSMQGFSNGEHIIENCKINNWYINEFSSQKGVNLYNIKPLPQNTERKLIEFRESNLDKFWFDNIAFDDYSLISFYRNKFGDTKFTSCSFPENYKKFDKFKTVANIHYPDRLDDNYYRIRYETFLQLKRMLENSGNFYEAQKFQSLSNEALKHVDDILYQDKLILRINSFSNNHGLSIKKPFLLILISSISLYICYLWSLGKIFNFNEDFNPNLVGYYFAFLDLTHRSDFLVKGELNGLSIAIDYLHKIWIGFLIYQFIASFRKYGKKQ